MISRRFVSLHAAKAAAGVALCAAQALPAPTADAPAPEWIHLLPTGTFRGVDGRGPYKVADAAELARVSMNAAHGGGLVLDENHSTDLAGPKGAAAPARGWIVELQARGDGIWGRVEWTKTGLELMGERAYRFISPVIEHLKDGTVTALLRASLINKPNLRGLTALHQETDMDLIAKLREKLKLDDNADEDAILAALDQKDTGAGTALQSALDQIGTAAGVAKGANAAAVLAGVQQLAAAKPEATAITALQAELAEVTTKLTSLQGHVASERAAAFVDAAIREGRVGVKPLREHYIAMHAADPARVEKEIGAMPKLDTSGARIAPPAGGQADELNDGDRAVVQLMGLDAEAFKKTKQAQQAAL